MLKESIECESCGIHIYCPTTIKEFKTGKLLKVCTDCAAYIRARNLESYDG